MATSTQAKPVTPVQAKPNSGNRSINADEVLTRAKARSAFLRDLSNLPGYSDMSSDDIVSDFARVLREGSKEDQGVLFADMAKHLPNYEGWSPEEIRSDVFQGFDVGTAVKPPVAAQPQPAKPSEPEKEPPLFVQTPSGERGIIAMPENVVTAPFPYDQPVSPEMRRMASLLPQAPSISGEYRGPVEKGKMYGGQEIPAQLGSTSAVQADVRTVRERAALEEKAKKLKSFADKTLVQVQQMKRDLARGSKASMMIRGITIPLYDEEGTSKIPGSILDQAENYLKEVSNTPTAGSINAIFKGIVDRVGPEVAPVFGALLEGAQNQAVEQAANKPAGKRTAQEQALVDSYAAVTQLRELNLPGVQLFAAGKGITDLAPYAVEFGTTQKVYEAAAKYITKGMYRVMGAPGVRNLLGLAAKSELAGNIGRLGRRAIADIGGGTLQSLTNAQRIYQNFTQRTLPTIELALSADGKKVSEQVTPAIESSLSDFLKSVGTNASDFVTERWGFMAENAQGFLVNTFFGRMMEKYRERFGKTSVAKMVDFFKDKTQFNGLAGEVWEEYVNYPIQTMVETGKPELMPLDQVIQTGIIVGAPAMFGAGARIGGGVSEELRRRKADEIRKQQIVDFAARFPQAKVRTVTGEDMRLQTLGQARREQEGRARAQATEPERRQAELDRAFNEYQQSVESAREEKRTRQETARTEAEQRRQREEIRKGFRQAAPFMSVKGVANAAVEPLLPSGEVDIEQMRQNLEGVVPTDQLVRMSKDEIRRRWRVEAKLPAEVPPEQQGNLREKAIDSYTRTLMRRAEEGFDPEAVRQEVQAVPGDVLPGGQPFTQEETDRIVRMYEIALRSQKKPPRIRTNIPGLPQFRDSKHIEQMVADRTLGENDIPDLQRGIEQTDRMLQDMGTAETPEAKRRHIELITQKQLYGEAIDEIRKATPKEEGVPAEAEAEMAALGDIFRAPETPEGPKAPFTETQSVVMADTQEVMREATKELGGAAAFEAAALAEIPFSEDPLKQGTNIETFARNVLIRKLDPSKQLRYVGEEGEMVAGKEKPAAAATEIPEFKNTSEAVAFGRQATPEQVAELKRLRQEGDARLKEMRAQVAQLREQGKDEEARELMKSMLTFGSGQNQFYREAYEAAEQTGGASQIDEILVGLTQNPTLQDAQIQEIDKIVGDRLTQIMQGSDPVGNLTALLQQEMNLPPEAARLIVEKYYEVVRQRVADRLASRGAEAVPDAPEGASKKDTAAIETIKARVPERTNLEQELEDYADAPDMEEFVKGLPEEQQAAIEEGALDTLPTDVVTELNRANEKSNIQVRLDNVQSDIDFAVENLSDKVRPRYEQYASAILSEFYATKETPTVSSPMYRAIAAKNGGVSPVPVDRAFYIWTRAGGDPHYEKMSGRRVIFPNFLNFAEFFLNQSEGASDWVITETMTGLRVSGRHQTRLEAISAARRMLETIPASKWEEQLSKHVEENGPSPRYRNAGSAVEPIPNVPTTEEAGPTPTATKPEKPKAPPKEKGGYPVAVNDMGNEYTIRMHGISLRSGWEWYGFRKERADVWYGFVHGFEDEYGTFSESELRENGVSIITSPKDLMGIMPPVGWKWTPDTVRRMEERANREEGLKPVKRLTEKIATTEAPKYTLLGVNSDGEQVFEDKNGVRSILKGNVRVTAPVSIIPTKAGIEYSASELPEQFKVVEQKTASDHLNDVVTQAGEGITEALDGLSKMFGGTGTLKTFPGGIDRQSLEAARPHLEKAWQAFKSAGKSFAQFVQAMVAKFGEQIRPYIAAVFPNEGMPSTPAEQTLTPVTKKDSVADFVNVIADMIYKDERVDARVIATAAEQFGLDAKERVVREAVEVAIMKIAQKIVDGPYTEQGKFERLMRLYEKQPNISLRTSTTVELQQYSTPVPLSFIGAIYTGANVGADLFEPSGGNGLFTIGSTRSNVTVNELDDVRRGNLARMGFKRVWDRDGQRSFTGWENTFRAVHTNPPFGGLDTPVMVDGYKITKKEHLMAVRALEAMRDDGKAAIIIGGHNKFDTNGMMTGADRIFFNWLYHFYNVDDIINVNGDVYSRQGAKFPIRMILVNGRKTTPAGAASLRTDKLESIANTFDDVYNRMMEVYHETVVRPDSDEGRPGRDDLLDTNTGRHDESRPVGDLSGEQVGTPDTGGGRAGGGGGRSGARPVPPSGVRPTGGPTVERPVTPPSPGTPIGDRAHGKPPSDTPTPKADRFDDVGRREDSQRDYDAQLFGDDALTVTYKPVSDAPTRTMKVPAGMAQDISRRLRELEDAYGSIDNYVLSKLEYDSLEELWNYVDGGQIDAIALAIDNLDRGEGMVIGDSTGTGKGRIAAMLIRYATRQDMRAPVFMTEKPYLFSDLYRDLLATGNANLRPLIINTEGGVMQDKDGNVVHKTPAPAEMKRILDARELPDGFDFVVLTYSQVQNPEQLPKKPAFLQAVAQDAIVILDESHNAAGESNTNAVMMGVMQNARGAIFLSATWAKNPKNMILYAPRTAIREANMSPQELVDAVTHGGVALQEILSADLAEAGQYIRRELGFDGINIERMFLQEKRAEHTRTADSITDIIREVIRFQHEQIRPVIQGISDEIKQQGEAAGLTQGTESLGVNNVDFTSKMHNVIEQLLFAIKADDVANLAIEQLKAGKKPVIAFRNTMEAFIRDLAIPYGEEIGNVDFSATMLRALNGVMRYTIRDAQGGNTAHQLTSADLTPQGKAEYARLSKKIKETTSGIKGSPIDWLIYRLEKAGYRVAEVTGRKLKVRYEEDKQSGKIRAFMDRRTESAKDVTKLFRQFNNGDADVLLLNASGSTGSSAHAAPEFKDHRPRVMIIHQPELDITKEIQKRGRINRKGQVVLPEYIYVSSMIPAEVRTMMMLQRKMRSLDANTTSKQKSAYTMDMPDFLNKYGDQVVVEFLKDNPEINDMIGDPLDIDSDEPRDMDAARRVSGRVAALPVTQQEEFYNEVVRSYEDLIAYLNAAGENDLQVQVMKLDADTKSKLILRAGKGGRTKFGSDTYLETAEVNVLRKPYTLDEIDKMVKEVIGDNSPVRYQRQIVEEFEKFYAEFEVREREKFAAKWDARKLQPQYADMPALYQQHRNEAQAKLDTMLEARKTAVGGVLGFFTPGVTYGFPVRGTEHGDTDLYSNSIFIGFQIDKKRKNPYAMSAIKLRFAIHDSRRYVPLPASRRNDVNALIARQVHFPEATERIRRDWDKQIINTNRQTRYIVTGNILQGMGEDLAKHGQLIAFTNINGDIRRGILVPEARDVEDDGYVNVPIVRSLKYIQNRLNVGDVITTNRGIDIEKLGRGMYDLKVAKSKKSGGQYFLNAQLKMLMDESNGEFASYGNQMIGTFTAPNLPKVLGVLQQVFGESVRIPRDQMENPDPQSEITMSLDLSGGLIGVAMEAGKKVREFLTSGTTEMPLSGVQFAPSEIVGLMSRTDRESRRLLKMLGIPMWIAEKYPGFGNRWRAGMVEDEGVWGVVDRIGVREYAENAQNVIIDILNEFKDANRLKPDQQRILASVLKDLNEDNPLPYELIDLVHGKDKYLKQRYPMIDDATLKVYIQIRRALDRALEFQKNLDRYRIIERGEYRVRRDDFAKITETDLQSAGFEDERLDALMLLLSDVSKLSDMQMKTIWSLREIREIIGERVIAAKYSAQYISNFFPMTRPSDHTHAVIAFTPEEEDTESDSLVDELDDEKESGQKYYATFGSAKEANEHANELARLGYRPAPGQKTITAFEINDEFYQRFGSWFTVEQLWALAEARGIATDDATMVALVKELKSRGFDRHFIRRQRIPGFQWTFPNVLKNTQEYVYASARRYAKYVALREAEMRMAKIDNYVPQHVKEYARRWLDLWVAATPREFEALRQGIYTVTLGASVSNFVQNLMQPVITTYNEIPIVMKEIGAGMVHMPTEAIFLKAYKDALAHLLQRAGKKLGKEFDAIPDAWSSLAERARRQGILAPLQLEQIAGLTHDPRFRYPTGAAPTRAMKKVWKGYIGMLAVGQRLSEVMNREHAFFAGLYIGENYAGLSGSSLYEFAVRMVQRTQFVFGPHNIQTAARSLDVNRPKIIRFAPKMLFLLRGFDFNYLSRVASVARSKSIAAYARTLGAIIGLAGLRGLPWVLFLYSLMQLWYTLSGSDETPEEKEREVLKPIEEKLGLPERTLSTGPVGAATGVETSGLLAAGNPIRSTDIRDIIGVPAGLAQRGAKAVKSAGRGQYAKAIEEAPITPRGVSSALKSKRMREEGVISEGGRVVMQKGELSEADLKKIGMGFTPTSLSSAYEAQRAESKLGDQRKPAYEGFMDRYVRAMARNDRQEMGAVQLEITKYNATAPIYAQINLAQFIKTAILRKADVERNKKRIPAEQQIKETFGQ